MNAELPSAPPELKIDRFEQPNGSVSEAPGTCTILSAEQKRRTQAGHQAQQPIATPFVDPLVAQDRFDMVPAREVMSDHVDV